MFSCLFSWANDFNLNWGSFVALNWSSFCCLQFKSCLMLKLMRAKKFPTFSYIAAGGRCWCFVPKSSWPFVSADVYSQKLRLFYHLSSCCYFYSSSVSNGVLISQQNSNLKWVIWELRHLISTDPPIENGWSKVRPPYVLRHMSTFHNMWSWTYRLNSLSEIQLDMARGWHRGDIERIVKNAATKSSVLLCIFWKEAAAETTIWWNVNINLQSVHYYYFYDQVQNKWVPVFMTFNKCVTTKIEKSTAAALCCQYCSSRKWTHQDFCSIKRWSRKNSTKLITIHASWLT